MSSEINIRKVKRSEGQISCGPGRTKQSFSAECNINNLMARYERTGELTHVTSAMPQYGDFSNVTDYSTALAQVELAKNLFADLPAHIRKMVDNDPGKFLDYMSNPRNLEEQIDLGLVADPQAAKPEAPPSTTVPLEGETTPPPSPVQGGE